LIAYRIVLITHLFGLAFGMGGAGTIDSIVLVAARRGRVTRELVEVVHAAAGLVAGAMALLAVSGAAFFAVGAEATPKFWAKMVIVGIACLNGLAAHRLVFPLIEAAAAPGTGRLHLRPRDARLAGVSAAVSAVSWSGALILGAWHGLVLGMAPILAAYAAALAGAVLVSVVFVAPRVFVIAQDRVGHERGRSLRDIPAFVAFTVALAVADAALAVAGRLHERRDVHESDHDERTRGGIDEPLPAWLPAGAGSPSRSLSNESRWADDQCPWPGALDRLDRGMDTGHAGGDS
jgi:hypothetical protein